MKSYWVHPNNMHRESALVDDPDAPGVEVVAVEDVVEYLRNVVAPAATTQDGADAIYAAADAVSRKKAKP